MLNFAHDLIDTQKRENYISYSLKSKKNIRKSQRREQDTKHSAFYMNDRDKIFPKKYLGQNFLCDKHVIEQIFQAIPLSIEESLLQRKIRLIEVGIGLGDLTKRLACKYPLLCYEIDRGLVALARDNLASLLNTEQLVIEEADALHVRYNNGYLFDSEYFLVSNLPYNIATPIILQVLKDSLCRGFLVMTQKEVAQKFCAKVTDKKYCPLSVMAEVLGRINYLFDVLPQSFIPQPKVDSAVFCFERHRDSLPSHLESTLKYAFISPRKKLFSNLTKWDWLGKAGTQEIFSTFDLTENIRPHELSSQEYCRITEFIVNLNKG